MPIWGPWGMRKASLIDREISLRTLGKPTNQKTQHFIPNEEKTPKSTPQKQVGKLRNNVD
jgi:hypothetical protein